MLSDGGQVDFVLEHFEEIETAEHLEPTRERPVWIDYASRSASAIDDEDLDTLPEPCLDDDITLVRARPVELTWWEAAKRGLRALSTGA